MKHLYRKPLLPVLLMIMQVFGICFMTLFQKGMEEDRQRIEDIYDNTHIYIEAFPEGEALEMLKMSTYRGDAAAGLEEITDSLVMLQCYYALCSPFDIEVFSTVYGTNHPEALAEHQNFTISWGEGFNRETFLSTEKEIACLMDKTLAESLGLSVGDSFIIVPTLELGKKEEAAPEQILTLAGTFFGKQSSLSLNALIVPDSIFLGSFKLLYNSSMINKNSFYRIYRLALNPVYNREIETVLEKIEEKLIDNYSLVTNAKTMKQAIRRIEQKLWIQEILRLPLLTVLGIAAAVIGFLLVLNLRTEIFLRFLVGERRAAVFLKMLISLLVILFLFAGLSLLLVSFTAGAEWIETAFGYLKVIECLTVLTMILPLIVICRKNLVKFYQQREV